MQKKRYLTPSELDAAMRAAGSIPGKKPGLSAVGKFTAKASGPSGSLPGISAAPGLGIMNPQTGLPKYPQVPPAFVAPPAPSIPQEPVPAYPSFVRDNIISLSDNYPRYQGRAPWLDPVTAPQGSLSAEMQRLTREANTGAPPGYLERAALEADLAGSRRLNALEADPRYAPVQQEYTPLGIPGLPSEPPMLRMPSIPERQPAPEADPLSAILGMAAGFALPTEAGNAASAVLGASVDKGNQNFADAQMAYAQQMEQAAMENERDRGLWNTAVGLMQQNHAGTQRVKELRVEQENARREGLRERLSREARGEALLPSMKEWSAREEAKQKAQSELMGLGVLKQGYNEDRAFDRDMYSLDVGRHQFKVGTQLDLLGKDQAARENALGRNAARQIFNARQPFEQAQLGLQARGQDITLSGQQADFYARAMGLMAATGANADIIGSANKLMEPTLKGYDNSSDILSKRLGDLERSFQGDGPEALAIKAGLQDLANKRAKFIEDTYRRYGISESGPSFDYDPTTKQLIPR